MVVVAARKVGRLSRLWPGRLRPVSGTPHAHLDTRTDPLPLLPLNGADSITMAHAGRRPEAENSTAQT
jgi:hypothetical protein